MISTGQKSIIQIAKAQLVAARKLTENEYRDELQKRFKQNSSTKLTSNQAGAFIEWLKSKGFKPLSKVQLNKIPAGIIALPTQQQMKLIEILKANICWKVENGYERWLKVRMQLNKVKSRQEASKVIEGLKGMLRIDSEIIHMRALPFPLDESFFITKHGEILPYRRVYNLETKRLVMIRNEEYT